MGFLALKNHALDGVYRVILTKDEVLSKSVRLQSAIKAFAAQNYLDSS